MILGGGGAKCRAQMENPKVPKMSIFIFKPMEFKIDLIFFYRDAFYAKHDN